MKNKDIGHEVTDFIIKVTVLPKIESGSSINNGTLHIMHKADIIDSYLLLELSNKIVSACDLIAGDVILETNLSLQENDRLFFFVYIRLEEKRRSKIILNSRYTDIAQFYERYKSCILESSTIMNVEGVENLLLDEMKKINTQSYFYQKIDIDAESKFQGVYNVGKGANTSPKVFVIGFGVSSLEEKVDHVLIGKGVTFDSGGMNLKYLSDEMLLMNRDMMGLALTFYSALLCFMHYPEKKIICILPTVENAIGPNSYRQQDIIRTYGGKTILVEHTDCEGRVIMADCIGFACEKITFNYISTIATLTGAVSVALGEKCVGYLTTNKEVDRLIKESSRTSAEFSHPLPNGERFLADMKRKRKGVDIANISKSRKAGATAAAKFLEFFVDEDKKSLYAHYDIAGYIESVSEVNATNTGSSLIEMFYLLIASL